MGRRQALIFWCEGAMNVKTRPWTAREDDQLRSMLAEGKTAAEIAVVLQRTRQSIYARVQRLYRERPLRDLYSPRSHLPGCTPTPSGFPHAGIGAIIADASRIIHIPLSGDCKAQAKGDSPGRRTTRKSFP